MQNLNVLSHQCGMVDLLSCFKNDLGKIVFYTMRTCVTKKYVAILCYRLLGLVAEGRIKINYCILIDNPAIMVECSAFWQEKGIRRIHWVLAY